MGITPAGAGKTAVGIPANIGGRDHPRRCGENSCRYTCKHRRKGSPPQVRGKQLPGLDLEGFDRITPAGAGKTQQPYAQTWDSQDHPRRCGENVKTAVTPIVAAGSPPQVRGKRIRTFASFEPVRITPAGAGKTLSCREYPKCCKDHPRRCGENILTADNADSKQGSPPQVRGKLNGEPKPTSRARITPAGAGKTGYGGVWH